MDEKRDNSLLGDAGSAGAVTGTGAVGSTDPQGGGGLADRLRPADPLAQGQAEFVVDMDRGDARGVGPEAADGAFPAKGASGEPTVLVRGESEPGNLPAPAVFAQEVVPEATLIESNVRIEAPQGQNAAQGIVVTVLDVTPPGGVTENLLAERHMVTADDDFLVACVSRVRHPTDFRCVKLDDRFLCGNLIWTAPCPRRAVPNVPLLDANEVREWA